MSIDKNQHQFKNRQLRQSIAILLLFCVTFLAHSEHYAQVELEQYLTLEQHDCHLCQQGIDTSSNSIELFLASTNIMNISNTRLINAIFISPAYVFPSLRAPPTIL